MKEQLNKSRDNFYNCEFLDMLVHQVIEDETFCNIVTIEGPYELNKVQVKANDAVIDLCKYALSNEEGLVSFSQNINAPATSKISNTSYSVVGGGGSHSPIHNN